MHFDGRIVTVTIGTVGWTRDAWQASSRVRIKESDLAPTPIALDQLDGGGWALASVGAAVETAVDHSIVRATRNPASNWSGPHLLKRSAERKVTGKLRQEPPRRTR